MPHGQPYLFSRSHLLFALTRPGGYLWVAYTIEQQIALQKYRDLKQQSIEEAEPFLRELRESTERKFPTDPAEKQRRWMMNAKIEAIGQHGLQNRGIEWLFHQRAVLVKSASTAGGPYVIRSLWDGCHEAAGRISREPIDLYQPPQLENWLEAIVAREEAERAVGIEKVKEEFGLDDNSAIPDASLAGAEKPQPLSAREDEITEHTCNVATCRWEAVAGVANCLRHCIGGDYPGIEIVLARAGRKSKSRTALYTQVRKGKVHVRDEHNSVCRHPRPTWFRVVQSRSKAPEIREFLANIASFDGPAQS